MTFIAFFLFAAALAASTSTIILTIGHAMPRITEVIAIEFAPAIQNERRIIYGKVKRHKPAPVAARIIAFPHKNTAATDYRLAA